MDVQDLESVRSAEKYFVGLAHPCVSKYCDGFMTEYAQESWNPFKAFLLCPDCESRLRIYKKEKEVN